MIHKKILFTFLLFVALLGIFLFWKGADNEKVPVKIGSVAILATIADTEEERGQGLSGRDFLPENEGVLFAFDTPGIYSFWMKEMKFPIDIIWIDEYLVVQEITEDLSPTTYPKTFSSATPIKYVLEINSGLSKEKGIERGSLVSF